MIGIAIIHGRSRVGFLEGHAISIDDSMIEMDVIAGDTHDALDQSHVRLLWLDEHNNVPTTYVAIGHPERPASRRS